MAQAAGGYDIVTIKAGLAKVKLAYRQMTEAAAYELDSDLQDFAPSDEELAKRFRRKDRRESS